jgi:carbonic anhydrase
LEQSPIIRERVKEGRVTVVGALYEIDSGQIQWLGPHPEQDDLVRAKKGRGKSGKRRR